MLRGDRRSRCRAQRIVHPLGDQNSPFSIFTNSVNPLRLQLFLSFCPEFFPLRRGFVCPLLLTPVGMLHNIIRVKIVKIVKKSLSGALFTRGSLRVFAFDFLLSAYLTRLPCSQPATRVCVLTVCLWAEYLLDCGNENCIRYDRFPFCRRSP